MICIKWITQCPICGCDIIHTKKWGRPKTYCLACTPFVRQHEHNNNAWRHTHSLFEYVRKKRGILV